MVSIPSEKEIKDTVFSFKTFKSPAPDGLDPFFYKKYGTISCGLLHKTFQDHASLTQLILPLSALFQMQ